MSHRKTKIIIEQEETEGTEEDQFKIKRRTYQVKLSVRLLHCPPAYRDFISSSVFSVSSCSKIRSEMPLEGVEPPLTCVNMDLNHARLPIPPQRLEFEIVAARQPTSQAAPISKLLAISL